MGRGCAASYTDTEQGSAPRRSQTGVGNKFASAVLGAVDAHCLPERDAADGDLESGVTRRVGCFHSVQSSAEPGWRSYKRNRTCSRHRARGVPSGCGFNAGAVPAGLQPPLGALDSAELDGRVLPCVRRLAGIYRGARYRAEPLPALWPLWRTVASALFMLSLLRHDRSQRIAIAGGGE